jgi:hypothetical protein
MPVRDPTTATYCRMLTIEREGDLEADLRPRPLARVLGPLEVGVDDVPDDLFASSKYSSSLRGPRSSTRSGRLWSGIRDAGRAAAADVHNITQPAELKQLGQGTRDAMQLKPTPPARGYQLQPHQCIDSAEIGRHHP